MMVSTDFLEKSKNREIRNIAGMYSVVEYIRDMSVTEQTAQSAYFESKMNFRKRQLAIELQGDKGVILQAGAMQYMLGNIDVKTNVKGAGDLIGKLVSSKVTNETAIKPRYTGEGLLVLEPTYKYLIVQDVETWGSGVVIDDGLFLACDDTVSIKTVARNSISSAVLGGKGLFNTVLTGSGYAVLECKMPAEELVTIELKDDVLKIDGPLAIAWSKSIKFTVEKTTKTLVGSAASGEGFVNVYRGTGKVLMAPVQ